MKLKIFLSLLFFIATTLSALHELEHISHDHDKDTACHVYHINDKLKDFVVNDNSVNIFIDFKQIPPLSSQTFTTHLKNKSDPNRAPPLYS